MNQLQTYKADETRRRSGNEWWKLRLRKMVGISEQQDSFMSKKSSTDAVFETVDGEVQGRSVFIIDLV